VEVSKRSDSSIVFTGELKGKLYLVDFSSNRVGSETCFVAKSSMDWLWHCRLAHVGMRNLVDLQRGKHILGLTNVSFEKGKICSACQAGKQVGAKYPAKNIVTTTRPLELLHMDLFGPNAYISIEGNKYDFVIIDDFSLFTWVFFLKDKSETQGNFKKFARRAQNEFEVKIKKVRSDNRTEFRNTNIEAFLDEEAARAMLDEYKILEKDYWAKAVNTACHAINRLHLHKIRNKTAYELLTGKKPKVDYFRVFGYKCFILNKKSKSSKFAPKVDEGFLLGYATNEHGYRVFNEATGQI
jgi:hypothetical protein